MFVLTVSHVCGFFSDYMRRSVESAEEAFDTFDNKPKDRQLTYQELQAVYLKYYFQRHVCVSIRPLVSPLVSTCVRRLAPIPAGESQDVTNKSCSICLMGDPWGPGCSRT